MIVYDKQNSKLVSDLKAAHELGDRLVESGAIRPDRTLQAALDYLDSGDDRVIVIGPDFAEYSFTFLMYVPNEYNNGLRPGDSLVRRLGVPELIGKSLLFNGGIIFHGPHDRGGDGGSPTFSVNLSPVNGWAVHT